MSDVFEITRGDTLPILEVQLTHNGEAYNASGSSEQNLYVLLDDGATYLQRSFTPELLASGIVHYQFQESDWTVGSGGSGTKDDPYTIGGVVVSRFAPGTIGTAHHRMEYEVVGPSNYRVTFKSDDILYVRDDYGDNV